MATSKSTGHAQDVARPESMRAALDSSGLLQLMCAFALPSTLGCPPLEFLRPWALNDQGIRCIIAPSFADIFFNK